MKHSNTGTVKFFNAQKGFGFIKDSNGQELFVHATGLTDEIRDGDDVKYNLKDGKKGPNAVDVELV